MYFFEIPAALSGRISIHRPRMLVLSRQQRRSALQPMSQSLNQSSHSSQSHGLSSIHPPTDMHGVGLRHRRSFAYHESPGSRVRSLDSMYQHISDPTEDSDDHAPPMQFSRRPLRRSTQSISVMSPSSAGRGDATSNMLSINPVSPAPHHLLSPTSSVDGSSSSRATRDIPRMISTLLKHSQSIKDSIQSNATLPEEALRPGRARSASAASSSHESKDANDGSLMSPTLAHLKSNALDEVLMSLRAALHALDGRSVAIQPDSSPTSGGVHTRRPSTRRLSNTQPPRRLDF